MDKRSLLAVLLLGVTLAACASPAPASEPADTPSPTDAPTLVYFHATW